MSPTHDKFVMNRLSQRVIRRKDAINKRGYAPLALQVFVNGKRDVFSLNILLKEENWNDKLREVVPLKNSEINREQATKLNDIITLAKNRASNIRHDFEMRRLKLNKDIFREEFKSNNVDYSFLTYCDEQIAWMRENKYHEPSTIKSLSESITKLRTFRDKIQFTDLSLELIKGFDAFLKNKVNMNTRMKHHKNLNRFINSASKKYRIENPYFEFKIKRIVGNREILSREEMTALVELFHTHSCNNHIQNVLQAFLFSCYTGMRISDIMLFKWEWIQGDSIFFIPQKSKNVTTQFLRIPLNEKAKSFLPEKKTEFVFNLPTKQYINLSLKTLLKMIESNKKISFHCARHTFATNFLRAGGAIQVLQELLGHSKIETTMIYVKIADESKDMQMRLMDFE